MRSVRWALPPVLAMLAAPPLAAQSGRPVTETEPTAKDVVATPATDLNLRKNEIPALLQSAEARPYTLRGLASCQQIALAIAELDAVLGEDVDLPREGKRRLQPGRVAQSVVGSLIPFRGVIREVSGANAHDRALQSAVLAGVARRAFLKGIGENKGCRYPARSVTLEVYNQRMAALEAGIEPPKPRAADAEPPAGRPAMAAARDVPEQAAAQAARPAVDPPAGRPAGATIFVSRPVVQNPY